MLRRLGSTLFKVGSLELKVWASFRGLAADDAGGLDLTDEDGVECREVKSDSGPWTKTCGFLRVDVDNWESLPDPKDDLRLSRVFLTTG